MINLETGRSNLSGQQVDRVVGPARHVWARPTPLGHLARQTRVGCWARPSCLGHRTR